MFTSTGLKRRLVYILAFILELLSTIPGTEEVTVVLAQIIAALGGAAVLHAGAAKTLPKEKLATAVAVLYMLIAIAQYVPALAPLVPGLYKLAGLLATARLGIAVNDKVNA